MVGPRSSDCFESETGVDDRGGDCGAEYLEAIALLQEEVARLEQELQWRDQRPSETTSTGAASTQSEIESIAATKLTDACAEIQRLEAELAGREETIVLLLDRLSRVEETEAASRAEWEHLAGWLAELEQRVEGPAGEPLLRLQEQLAAQRLQTDECRRKAEEDRRAAAAQRQADAGEIARLQTELARIRAAAEAAAEGAGGASVGERASAGSGPDPEVVEALRSENLRLRAAWDELAGRTAAEPPGTWEARLAEAVMERDALRRQLEQVEDEGRRERLEHRATLADVQAQLARAALAGPEAPVPETDPGAARVPRERDVDLRIQTLRQHLLEIHLKEEQERKQKQFIPRLSRLWSRTGPR